MSKKLEEKKAELRNMIQQYNQMQQNLQQMGQRIFKLQGAIEVLEELEKENKKEK